MKLTGGGIKVDDEKRARGGADGVGIRAVKGVTALMDRYGVEKVKEIVEVFG